MSKIDIQKNYKKEQRILYLGLIIFLILLILPSPKGLTMEGKNVLAILFFQMYLLITQALPFGVVGLVPIIFLPILNIMGTKMNAELLMSSVDSYANDVIFLVIAGFFIGGAMQKWGLHKRISYNIASVVGKKPSTILLGFMIATSVISMFLTNTATVVMMMPIAVAFIKATELEKGNLFAAALVTSISYSANIGGVGTPTGSSLSAGAIGLIPELTGKPFTYSMYLGVGIPFVIFSIFFAWLILKLLYKPDKATGTEKINKEVLLDAKKGLGKITKNEIYIIIILLLLVFGLLTRSLFWGKYLPLVTDGAFAILTAFILFLIPTKNSENLYTWKDGQKDIDFGLLLMVGGFLTVGKLLGPTGVTAFLASSISKIEGVGGFTGVYFLGGITNLLSNFGVNMFAALPLSHAVAEGLKLSIPLTLLTVTCLAQLNISLPERATNALSIGTGYATVKQLLLGGVLISISNIIIAPIVIRFITMGIFKIGVGW